MRKAPLATAAVYVNTAEHQFVPHSVGWTAKHHLCIL